MKRANRNCFRTRCNRTSGIRAMSVTVMGTVLTVIRETSLLDFCRIVGPHLRSGIGGKGSIQRPYPPQTWQWRSVDVSPGWLLRDLDRSREPELERRARDSAVADAGGSSAPFGSLIAAVGFALRFPAVLLAT